MAKPTARRCWDQRDLIELLPLEASGPGTWRSTVCETSSDGRVHGGQLLGQALWAAAQTAPGRSPSMLQMAFLQGARPDHAIEYSVETLQEDRCFSTRRLYGVQGTGLVMSANVSFQATQPQDGAQQGLAPSAPAPESLPTLGELAERYPHRGEVLQRRFTGHPVLDIRPTDPEGYLERPDMPCWMRLAQPLCADGCLQQAALAYMSEGWLNASLAPAQGMLDAWQHAYISVLNQTLWFHSPELNVNEWILFVSTTVRGFSGRGLATTHLYQRDGRLLASMAQDVLMVARTA